MIAPGGRFALVADLGADRVFVYPFDRATATLGAVAASVATKAGSGPRHIAFHAGGRFVYVNSELTGEVTTYDWDGATGGLTPITTISTLPPGYAGEKSAGEIAMSRDGRFLYVSNRGEGTIVVYAVAANGGLQETQRIASGGKTPWHFAVDPSGRWFLVANEGSDTVSVFALATTTGKLTPTAAMLKVAHPSSIAFVTGG